jgi:hypothetical protein
MAIQVLTRKAPAVVSKRKHRYATDVDYREKAKKLSRKAYRNKANVDMTSCLYSLQFLDKLTEDQDVKLPNGKQKRMAVASIPKTATMLQMLYQTLWRWVDNGIIPSPVLMSTKVRGNGKRDPYPVYHKEEVRILIEEVGEHQKTITYLRRDHLEVRARIESRFVAIRKKLKIG